MCDGAPALEGSSIDDEFVHWGGDEIKVDSDICRPGEIVSPRDTRRKSKRASAVLKRGTLHCIYNVLILVLLGPETPDSTRILEIIQRIKTKP